MGAVVVGVDGTAGGDAALRAAAALAGGAAEPPQLVVVVVVTQQDLDTTGELDAESKKRVALERAYPQTWKRIERVYDEAGVDEGSLQLDVEIRFAAVHLVRSQERIAAELLAAADERGADRVVLGRRGRPDCVAEHVLAHGDAEPAPPGAPDGSLVVRLRR